jgi:signal transduction histidine kinase
MSGEPDERLDALLDAALDLASEHELERILDHTAERATTVARCRYAALGVFNMAGDLERFAHSGMDGATVARIGHLPQGHGLLGAVVAADRPIRLADPANDARAEGFPPGHPHMSSFLGVPVMIANRRFGNLYLAEKLDGCMFDDDDERFVVLLATFAACAIESARLVDAERDRAHVVSDLAAAHERAHSQREMLRRIIDAQEAERGRVARDLHDQIGQALTSVLLALRLVDGSLADDGAPLDEARARSADVRELVTQALDEVRQLAFELRPTVLDDVGLVAAVERLVGDIGRRSNVRIDLLINGLDDERRLSPEQETVTYRVIQEALNNVARHAEASRAAVTISANDVELRAEITDNGIGFEPDDRLLHSLGLAGMVERAALAGGAVDIASAPGDGTTVKLEVPR